MYNKIKELSSKRIKFLIENQILFYKWNETYVKSIKWELEEVENEIKEKNSVYLEDELWDVFWTYICLLHSLENEWKITSVENVLNRCYEKFTWRVWINWNERFDWEEVKKIQKEKLKLEHNKLYNDN